MPRKRRSGSEPIKFDSPPEINKLIARFLEDVAKDFSEFSDIKAVSDPLIYGFNVRVAKDGMPQITSFGNVRPAEPKVKYGDDREPLVDILDKDKDVTIIAELPGVEKRAIRITAYPGEITLEARDHGHNYNKKVKLSGTVNPNAKSAKFHNGVLELVFAKSSSHTRPSIITITD